MQTYQNYGNIKTICIIGYGSIGQGLLPIIKRHFTFDSITVIDPVRLPEASQNVKVLKVGLTPANYKQILGNILVQNNSFCVNVSVSVSSFDIMIQCQERGAIYIDTARYKWDGQYSDKVAEVTNHALRHEFHTKEKKFKYKKTAIGCCGANPGMASWFVKQAIINIAKQVGYAMEEQPKTRQQWARLMMNLGVKGIHIAQRDTQRIDKIRPSKQFWNTWSVEGFLCEGTLQASELGWGTNQKWMPSNAFLCQEGQRSTVYLNQPGMNTQVKTWCPTLGPQFGFLVTHDESISIAEYFTVKEGDKLVYRPTCHYAYHPTQDAVSSVMETLGSGEPPKNWKIFSPDQITEGMDELGVLIYGHEKNAYWYGSQLDINKTRKMAPMQNATGLQVTSAILAAMVWAMENPEKGYVQADQMDYKRCLQVQRMYIQPVNGYYTDWTPLKNKITDFGADNYDLTDPWQFKNIIFHK